MTNKRKKLTADEYFTEKGIKELGYWKQTYKKEETEEDINAKERNKNAKESPKMRN